MPRQSSASQLTVFLFTDLVDSAALARQLGDVDYVRTILEPHNRLFRDLLRGYPSASEVKHTGDGFMATFATASDAVDFALRFHLALETEAWEKTGPQTRIGIHLGEAVEFAGAKPDQRDLAGDAANVAARFMGLATPRQTLLSRVAFDSARQSGRVGKGAPSGDAREKTVGETVDEPIVWLNHGRYRLKGADEPLEVCEAGMRGRAPLKPPADSDKAQRIVRDDEVELLGWRPSPGGVLPHRADWVLQKPLGQGGFGEVWLARHKRTREQRAIKFCFDAERLRSFKREITFFRLIRDHLGERPDMARLYDVHVDAPPFFLEGEYVHGGSMQEWSDAHGGIATIPLELRLRLLAGVSEAVAAAHSLGIIHKDLKPSNVLISERDGTPFPKLVDFGIGVLADRSLLHQHQITATGFTESLLADNSSSRTGTRLYQPPEAQLNRPATTAGDVYALGVMLYQLVTGDLSRPLGTGWEEDVDDDLLRADIRDCTHRDPHSRLGSASELAERLTTLGQRREEREAQRRAARHARRVRQLRIGLVAAACCTFLLGGLTAFIYVQWRRAEISQRRAIDGEREAERQREAATTLQQLAERNAESARQQTQLAEQRLRLAERSAYNLQLRRVQDIWRDDPGEALMLLENQETCPENLREFAWRQFYKLVRRDQIALRGHQGPVRAISFLPDGLRLASGGYDGYVRLWDLDAGRTTATLPPVAKDSVLALAVSPAGDQLAVCQGPSVRLWSIESASVMQTIVHPDRLIAAVAYAGSGELLAVGDTSGTIKVWNPSNGALVRELQGHQGAVHGLAFTADGASLASACHDGTVKIWDVASGTPRHTLSDHASCVRSVAFSPRGDLLASGSEDKSVILWDPATGEQKQWMRAEDFVAALRFSADGQTLIILAEGRRIELRDLNGERLFVRASHRDSMWALALSNDGRRVATASDQGDILVRDWEQMRNADADPSMAHSVGYGLAGAANSLAISPDGKWLVAAEEEAQAFSVWELPSCRRQTMLAGHQAYASCAAFNADGTLLASGAADGVVRLWNSADWTPAGALEGHADHVTMLRFSADGSALFVASESSAEDRTGGEVRIWDVATRKLAQVLTAADEEIWSFAVSPDGKRLVAGGGVVDDVRGGSMSVWDLETGKKVRKLDYEGGVVFAMEYSPDGLQLATGNHDGWIELWDPIAWERRRNLDAHTSTVHGLAYSPDGKTLASAGHDAAIKLWDPETGHERATLEGHRVCVRDVAFSPAGETLYSGSEDRTIRIWGGGDDAARRQPHVESYALSGHAGMVSAVAFHPQGKLVASAGEDDKTLCVWDLEKRTRKCVFRGHEMPPRSLAFDGPQRLISSSADSTIRVWDLESNQQVAHLDGHGRYVAALDVSSDGKLLASGAEDRDGNGELILWDLPTQRQRIELRRTASNALLGLLTGGPAEEIWGVAFSPDGALLATGGGATAGGAQDRSELLLWNVAEGKVLRKIAGHAALVRAVDFSPDGLQLASCDARGQVQIARVDTGAQEAIWAAHGDLAFDVKFSPDGRLLATCGNDWIVRLWDVATRNELATLDAHLGPVRAIDFSPDGTQLATASEDQSVRIWDLRQFKTRQEPIK